MNEHTTDSHPLSNLAYDWIALMQNKAQALNAYDQYIQDAEAAGSAECAAFFRKVHDALTRSGGLQPAGWLALRCGCGPLQMPAFSPPGAPRSARGAWSAARPCACATCETTMASWCGA